MAGADKDTHGNHIEGDVIALDTKGSLIHSHDRHLVATIGLDDVVVVTTPDATLAVRRDASHEVKKIVDRLKSASRTEHDLHRVVRRPWRSYDSRESGHRFQVKRIIVKPGATLSLQMHHHRAEDFR